MSHTYILNTQFIPYFNTLQMEKRKYKYILKSNEPVHSIGMVSQNIMIH